MGHPRVWVGHPAVVEVRWAQETLLQAKVLMVEAPEPPHHHHHPTGLPWFDLIVPIAVVCLSVASLLTSLQSEKSMHALVEQNTRLVEAQSTPLLMLDSSNLDGGKPVLSMTLSNVGTGPAQIAWFRIRDVQGLDYSSGALEDRIDKVYPRSPFISQQIDQTFLRSGDQRTVFQWPKPVGKAAAVAAWEGLNKARFHLQASACYCSIFEECRVTGFEDSRPKVVASCESALPGR